MRTAIAPLPATSHIAWAELGLVLDDTHCGECGRGLTFDSWGNRWCGDCDPEIALMLEAQDEAQR